MPVLDFKEIPEANVASGAQDTFELFARDFVDFMGFAIISGPGRGADGGADLIAEETRRGIAGETRLSWLVSCKHKAHSGSSVTLQDEKDIWDRVEANGCNGFIGLYSTLPSSGLLRKLEGLERIEHLIYDAAKIESSLLASGDGIALADRYFRQSLRTWKLENPEPASLFSGTSGLPCEQCGRRLAEAEDGIVVVWTSREDETNSLSRHYERIYWCCKGVCDRALNARYSEPHTIDAWEDIPDLRIPTSFIRWLVSVINQLHQGYTYEPDALEQQKRILLELFPYVARQLTSEEQRRLRDLATIPAGL